MKRYFVVTGNNAEAVASAMSMTNPYFGFRISSIEATPRKRTFLQWLFRRPRVWDVTVTLTPTAIVHSFIDPRNF